MQGKRRTNPNGIDIFEFPFNRIRRRKKDNLGKIDFFSLLRSSIEGRAGAEGNLFVRRCSMLVMVRSRTSEPEISTVLRRSDEVDVLWCPGGRTAQDF